MRYKIGSPKDDRKKPRNLQFFAGVAARWLETVAAVAMDVHVFRSKLEANTRFSVTNMQPINKIVCFSGHHLGFQLLVLEEYTAARVRSNLSITRQPKLWTANQQQCCRVMSLILAITKRYIGPTTWKKLCSLPLLGLSAKKKETLEIQC